MVDQLGDYGYNKSADATSLNSASLTGFPAFIRIEQSGDTTGTGVWGIDTSASIDGVEDFGFFNENGDPLDFYAVTIDHANGVYEFWVRLDLVRDGGEEIQLGYGSGNTDDTATETTVWDGVSGIAERWNLDGDADGSTSSNIQGSLGTGVSTSSDTFMGTNGLDFDGSSSAYVDFGSPTVLEMADTNNVTVISFQKYNTITGNPFTEMYDPSETNVEYELGPISIGNNDNSPKFGFYDGSWHNAQVSSTITTGSIEQMAGSYDGSTLRAYHEGNTASTSDSSGLPPRDENYEMRRHDDADIPYLDATVYELQVYEATKSDEWIQSIRDMTSIGGYSLFSANASTQTDQPGTVKESSSSLSIKTNSTLSAKTNPV